MHKLLIGGIIISSFIKHSDLQKELNEAQEAYPNKQITIANHAREEVVKYYEQMFHPFDMKKEII